MDQRGGTPSRWRRGIRALLLVPAALGLTTCFLPTETSPNQRIAFVLPADPVLVTIGATVAVPVKIQANGATLADARVQLESMDSTVASVGPSGEITGRRWDTTTVRVVLVSGATGTAPPETTFVVRAIIGGMTLSRSVDTLFALGDTLLFRPGYLDAAGSHLSAADSAAIRPSYQLVSAGLAVRLDPSSGKISAKANGTDTVQAMVDTSAIRLVVRVRQRAAKLSVSPSPSDTLRALQATRQFSVLAWDSKDSLIAQPAVTWKSSDGAVVTITPDLGLATAVANGVGSITATVDTASATVPVIVNQVPRKLAFTVQPTGVAAGSAIAPAVQVAVQDSLNNTVVGAATLVTVMLGANPGGGTLAGTLNRTAVNGIATFADLSLSRVGTGYTLAAGASGLAAATSTGFDVNAGPPSQLAFTIQPGAAVAGAALAPAVQVSVQDAFGNTVGTATTAVVIAIATPVITLAVGTNPAGGTLAGTTSKSAVNGVATFSDLTIAKAGSGYTLTAATAGLTAATSTVFDITAGAAVRLAFTVQPGPTVVGTAIKPALQVAVQDTLGNTVTTATSVITIALGTNPAGGTLSGTLSRSAVGGVATFGDLSINTVGTGYTLRSTATGLTGATSAGFDVRAAATKLALTVQPSLTVAGKAMTPGVQVAVQDAAGNTVTTASTVITITMGANANGVTLSGTTTRSAVNGIATFSDLSIDSVGSGYTFTATATGLASAGSASFDVTASAPAKLAFSVQPVTTPAGQGISPAVRVVVQDAFGNTVTGFTGNVTVAITSGTGSPNATLGGATTVPAAAGVATFTGLSIDKVATGYTLAAAVSGLAGTTSAAFAITPAAPVKLAVTGQPVTTTAGALFTPAVQVTILDGFGNTVKGYTGTVTVAITGGTGSPNATLAGTRTVFAAAGVATFSDLSIDKAASGYSLTAT